MEREEDQPGREVDEAAEPEEPDTPLGVPPEGGEELPGFPAGDPTDG